MMMPCIGRLISTVFMIDAITVLRQMGLGC